eukprot:359517-Chlamydomonas_euryale.AAC.27
MTVVRMCAQVCAWGQMALGVDSKPTWLVTQCCPRNLDPHTLEPITGNLDLITFLIAPATPFRPPSTKSDFNIRSNTVTSCAPHHLRDGFVAYKSAPR